MLRISGACLGAATIALWGRLLFCDDCNLNGVEDGLDLTAGTSRDCDADRIPDECAVQPVLAWDAPRTIEVLNGPVGVSAADLDRDGHPDLILTPLEKGSLMVLLGDGRGSFRQLPPNEVRGSITQVAAADLDGDQDLDLAIACQQSGAEAGGLFVLPGNGDGSFGPPAALDAQRNVFGVAIGDFDRDAIPDLFTAGESSGAYSLALFRGKGDGMFGAAERFPRDDFGSRVRATDLNRDGTPDLVVKGSALHFAFLSRGDGTFQETARLGTGYDSRGDDVADFDRDGFPDLVVADWHDRGGIRIWPGKGDGTFGADRTLIVGEAPYLAIARDLNADSIPDLVVGNGPFGGVSSVLGKADGGFGPAEGFLSGGGFVSMAVADLDGDGAPDLAISNDFPYRLSILSGTGDGAFRSGRLRVKGAGQLASGDFDGDGRSDLVSVEYHRGSVHLGRGKGELSTASSFAGGDGGLAVADFNADGRQDLVVTSVLNPPVQVLTAKADATMETARILEVEPGSAAAVAADLDGNELPDIAIAVTNRKEVAVFRATGPANFAMPLRFSLGAFDAFDLRALDLNRDGDLDLVAATPQGDRILALLGDGKGTFLPPQDYGAGRGAVSIAGGDLDEMESRTWPSRETSSSAWPFSPASETGPSDRPGSSPSPGAGGSEPPTSMETVPSTWS
jgi:hypothetical protein